MPSTLNASRTSRRPQIPSRSPKPDPPPVGAAGRKAPAGRRPRAETRLRRRDTLPRRRRNRRPPPFPTARAAAGRVATLTPDKCTTTSIIARSPGSLGGRNKPRENEMAVEPQLPDAVSNRRRQTPSPTSRNFSRGHLPEQSAPRPRSGRRALQFEQPGDLPHDQVTDTNHRRRRSGSGRTARKGVRSDRSECACTGWPANARGEILPGHRVRHDHEMRRRPAGQTSTRAS